MKTAIAILALLLGAVTGVAPATATAVVDENASSRIAGLRVTLAVLAVLALLALFLSGSIPTAPVGSEAAPAEPSG